MRDFNANRFSQRPGVYQMLSDSGDVLYVGKAKNLRKRLSSYFRKQGLSSKTQRLMEQVVDIKTIITHSENEALLLESNLIKTLMPRYNILFRDDKSYPYLHLSTEAVFPRLCYQRGGKKKKGRYFGPYPSALSAKETLDLLQKLFMIRQCDDTFFKNRSRPCLQYQIKRCTAPCVGYIEKNEYDEAVQHVVLFLEGKSRRIAQALEKKMDAAARGHEYEQAALYRDKISSLSRIQEQQYVTDQHGDIDVIGIAMEYGEVCIQLLSIRGGRMLGSKPFAPKHLAGDETSDVLAAFLKQHYLLAIPSHDVPVKIVIPQHTEDKQWIASALSEHCKKKVSIVMGTRGEAKRWRAMAQENAAQTLHTRLREKASMRERFSALRDALSLDESPRRIECFDISHHQGEKTIASCVVFTEEGPDTQSYRRFNIDNVTPGDDYGAMKEALTRHYSGLKTSPEKMPDFILIDGGKGQLAKAENVLTFLQINDITLFSIAKGQGRKPGRETLYRSGQALGIVLPEEGDALHLLQHIRDEAHRFAITGHRRALKKKKTESILEHIPGIGAKRRQHLLRHFGGLQSLKRASAESIAQVTGISKKLAEHIYDHLHPQL